MIAPAALLSPVTVTLRSGVMATLRALTPADRAIYLDGVDHVGSESRRLRFFAAKPWLSEGEIRYFTDVDHHDHEAIIALVDGAVVGVARAVRDREDPRVAELGVVVTDQWQGRGVGTALVRRIVERASEEGVDQVRASLLADNRGMLATIRRLGVPWRTVSPPGPVIEIEIETGPGGGARVSAGPVPGTLRSWTSLPPRTATGAQSTREEKDDA